MTTKEMQEMQVPKEFISIEDIAKMYGINYQQASKLLLDIKRKLTIGKNKQLRWEVQGKIHVADYFDALDVPLSVGYAAMCTMLSKTANGG